MYCKDCKFFGPVYVNPGKEPKYCETHPGKGRVQLQNYGGCGNPKIKVCQPVDYYNTNDEIVFTDAGECPDLFVGVNFGCVHFESKQTIEDRIDEWEKYGDGDQR